MTDTNASPIGLGIDLRVTGVACALSDGRTAELLAGPTGESRSPPELHATDTGVEARPPGFTSEPSRRIPVLPRYDDERRVSPAEYAGRFELELESLTTELADGWRESAPSTLDALGRGSDGGELPPGAVVLVPGVYDCDDRAAVAQSVEAAGLDVGAVVRAPVAVAAAEFPAIAEPQLLVVVDVGAHWFDAALVEVDPDEVTYRVVSRVSADGIGRTAMDEALAEWVIERAAREENRRVTYEEASIEHLREAAGDALVDIASDADASIVVDEVPGMTSDDGLTLGVDTDIDMSDAYEALEDIEKAIIGRLRDLFDTTDVTRPDVDRVLVTGPGIDPGPIANAVSGFLDRPLGEPHLGGRETASPRGAALLATQFRRAGTTPIRQETLDRDVGLLVPTDGRTAFETVVPGSAPVGSSKNITLKTTRDDQTRGKVTVATRHLGSGDITTERSYEVTGVPPRRAGEASVSLTVTGRSEEEGGIEVSPSLPDDGDATLSLDPPTDTAPRLTLPEMDPSDLDASEADDATLATRAEAGPLDDLSPQSILGRIMSVRYNLWHTVQADAALDSSDVENLLKEFTAGMRRLDIEPIEPDPGDKKDLMEHTVWKTRPSEEPNNTILEVRKPGYRIGDYVEETADVIVSKGEPESTDDAGANDEATDDTETTGDAGSAEDKSVQNSTDPRPSDQRPADGTVDRKSTGEAPDDEEASREDSVGCDDPEPP